MKVEQVLRNAVYYDQYRRAKGDWQVSLSPLLIELGWLLLVAALAYATAVDTEQRAAIGVCLACSTTWPGHALRV